MKKIIIFIFVALLILTSCSKPSSLPPVNDKYATEIIMPPSSSLTSQERSKIGDMKREYEESIRNN